MTPVVDNLDIAVGHWGRELRAERSSRSPPRCTILGGIQLTVKQALWQKLHKGLQ